MASHAEHFVFHTDGRGGGIRCVLQANLAETLCLQRSPAVLVVAEASQRHGDTMAADVVDVVQLDVVSEAVPIDFVGEACAAPNLLHFLNSLR